MSASVDKRLILSILDYLDSVKGFSKNKDLTDEAIRLLQSLFIANC